MAVAGIEVSAHTVRRRSHAEGFHARTPRRTPLLTHKHKKTRIHFAEGYLNKPQRFWHTILWTDTTKLELFGTMDRRYIWRKKNEAVGNITAARLKSNRESLVGFKESGVSTETQ